MLILFSQTAIQRRIGITERLWVSITPVKKTTAKKIKTLKLNGKRNIITEQRNSKNYPFLGMEEIDERDYWIWFLDQQSLRRLLSGLSIGLNYRRERTQWERRGDGRHSVAVGVFLSPRTFARQSRMDRESIGNILSWLNLHLPHWTIRLFQITPLALNPVLKPVRSTNYVHPSTMDLGSL